MLETPGAVDQRMPFRFVASCCALFLLMAGSLSASPLDAAMREVEQLRGLKFLHPVENLTIDRSEIPDRLRKEMQRTLPYTPDDYALILKTLRFVDPETTELIPRLLALYETQVLAYYDPAAHIYYSIRQPPGAVAGQNQEMLGDVVTIHELTHALQDQRFHIGEHDDALRNDWDASLAYHALIEGEASLVMMASLITRAGGNVDDVLANDTMLTVLADAAAKQQIADPATPRYFVKELTFPYIDGITFVVTAYRRGGWAAVDLLFANPPRSTREILHPDDYFRRAKGSVPDRVPAFEPNHEMSSLTTEHLGEFHWAFLVGAANARGWKDDRVTIVQDLACDPTVLAETLWESPERAAVFREAYDSFLQGQGIAALILQQGPRVRISYGADRKLMRRWVGQK